MNNNNEKNALDELKLAAIDLVNYFEYHNKNITKKQEDKIYRLREALYNMGEKLY